VEVERHETEEARWEVARGPPTPLLRPYLVAAPEGWERAGGPAGALREVPFPGIPLILNLGAPWEIDEPDGRHEVRDSFVAGLHAAPSLVHGASSWACIELQLTPLGAHRLLGVPMHELANRTVGLEDLLPHADELATRLREAASWADRFDLVEAMLLRRLTDSAPPPPAIVWSWQQLRRSGGRVPIATIASELGWSHRRLIARFREHIGLAPKTAARVLRFDRAVAALRSPAPRGLAQIALACGYFDQAHLNRDFRELAGTTPTAFIQATREGGGTAA
jgi:AraC-like DNA-binding protein